MPERVTVLVTGVGALIGYGIMDGLRRSGLDVRVVAMDMDADAYGRYLADDWVGGVPATDASYLPFIQRVVAEHAVDLIIPGIEQDLYALWGHKDSIMTRAVLNNDLCLRLSKSKLEAFHYFNELDEPFVIPTLHKASYDECVSRLGSPFILKPSFSYASKGLALIQSERQFAFHTEQVGVDHAIYQRRIGTDEEEYTISVFGDGQGGYFDSIILKRRLTAGGTFKARLVAADPAITAAVDAICRRLRPIGPTNIQLRKEDGSAFLLEVNPRISSACSIRTLMGYNEPAMCVRYFLRNEAPTPGARRAGSVVRYFADHFVDG